MKTLIASAALALAFTAPAFANDQLAASLGVDAGQYTLSELAQIKANQDTDGGVKILVGGSDDAVFSSRGQSAGYAQLAASLGVDAGQYTLSELVQIKANQDDDTGPRIVIGGDDAASVSTRGGTAGYAQLAASLGVDAGVYTLSELVQIKADQDEDEGPRFTFIR